MQCKMIDFSRQDTVIRDHFRSDIRIKYFVWGFKASLQPTGRRVAEQTQILMILFFVNYKRHNHSVFSRRSNIHFTVYKNNIYHT